MTGLLIALTYVAEAIGFLLIPVGLWLLITSGPVATLRASLLTAAQWRAEHEKHGRVLWRDYGGDLTGWCCTECGQAFVTSGLQQ